MPTDLFEKYHATEKMITEAEYTIINFLRASPETYYARKEIARRAVRRQEYEENPHWADAALEGLLLKAIIEKNENGLYRLKQDAEIP